MTDRRIGRLPDRSPVRITAAAAPDRNQVRADAATVYGQTDGAAEAVAERAPFMRDSFRKSDRAVAKLRKKLASPAAPAARPRHGRATSTRSSSTQAQEE